MPAWLRVRQIGQLKQVVAELIVVILLVLFLRVALQSFGDPNLDLNWMQIATILLLPISTALLALAFAARRTTPQTYKANHCKHRLRRRPRSQGAWEEVIDLHA